MKYLAAICLMLALAAPAAALTCPSNVTSVGGATACWPMQETSGTTITDTIGSNNGTINGGYTLNQNGGIACSASTTGPSGNNGCNINTATNYSNPQPFTLYADFAGNSGGIAQLAPSNTQSLNTTPYAVLYLDNFGKLTFGINNLNSGMVLQSPLAYADGNEHKAAVSIGPNGMRMYVDGKLVTSRNVQLVNYINGYWFFGGINGTNWALSQSYQNFNGTLYTTAWWNGTQLTDKQGQSLTGGNPTPITNSYCTFSNQIASLNPEDAMAYANQTLTFTVAPQQIQLPGGGSNLPIGPSTQQCYTDSSGNIESGCSIPQGAHVNLSVGVGAPIPLVIPFSTSCDLTSLLLSQTDPPEVVDAVATAGPLFAGVTVTNPPPGQIGTATITAPAAYSQTATLTATVDVDLYGNNQQVVMGGNTAISLTDFQSGAIFYIDTQENATGGYTPSFSVPAGWSLVWPAGGSQPGIPSTSAGVHNVWVFVAVNSTTLFGAINATSPNTFPLSATANFNYYSANRVNSAELFSPQSPTPTVTATCTGTCSTNYLYYVACVGDSVDPANPTVSLPAPIGGQGAVNASSLSNSNYNDVTWSAVTGCTGGYQVWGRVSGSIGKLATCPGGTGCIGSTGFQDTGADSPSGILPTRSTTGSLFVGDLAGFYPGGTIYAGGSPTSSLANPQILVGNIQTTYAQIGFEDLDNLSHIWALGDDQSQFSLIDLSTTDKVFQVDITNDYLNIGQGLNMVGGAPINFLGSGGGNAVLGVANNAGTPNQINLPIFTGSANALLMTNGSSPQQTSWTLTPSLTSLSLSDALTNGNGGTGSTKGALSVISCPVYAEQASGDNICVFSAPNTASLAPFFDTLSVINPAAITCGTQPTYELYDITQSTHSSAVTAASASATPATLSVNALLGSSTDTDQYAIQVTTTGSCSGLAIANEFFYVTATVRW